MAAKPQPQFFIAGAPKCGTTALYSYLAQHARIFMPRLKEPHYFAADFAAYRNVRDRATYDRLFAAAAANQLCGEASVWYLHSDVALERIVREHPDAKVIVMLRDPVDMVVSLHQQMLYSMREDVVDLTAAWALEERRARGEGIPSRALEPRHLQYRWACTMAPKLRRLFDLVPPERRLCLLFDDLAMDTRTVYGRVLEFLEVPSDGRTSFAPVNRAKLHRWPAAARTLHSASLAAAPLKRQLRRVFPALPSSLLKPLYDRLTAEEKRPPLDPDFEAMLCAAFRDDVNELEILLGRDLSGWKPMADQC